MVVLGLERALAHSLQERSVANLPSAVHPLQMGGATPTCSTPPRVLGILQKLNRGEGVRDKVKSE